MKGLYWTYLRFAGRVLLNRKHVYLIRSIWSVLWSMKTDIILGLNKLFNNFQTKLEEIQQVSSLVTYLNLKACSQKGLPKFAMTCRESEHQKFMIFSANEGRIQSETDFKSSNCTGTATEDVYKQVKEVMPQERRIQTMRSFVITQKGDRERELLSRGTCSHVPGESTRHLPKTAVWEPA